MVRHDDLQTAGLAALILVAALLRNQDEPVPTHDILYFTGCHWADALTHDRGAPRTEGWKPPPGDSGRDLADDGTRR